MDRKLPFATGFSVRGAAGSAGRWQRSRLPLLMAAVAGLALLLVLAGPAPPGLSQMQADANSLGDPAAGRTGEPTASPDLAPAHQSPGANGGPVPGGTGNAAVAASSHCPPGSYLCTRINTETFGSGEPQSEGFYILGPPDAPILTVGYMDKISFDYRGRTFHIVELLETGLLDSRKLRLVFDEYMSPEEYDFLAIKLTSVFRDNAEREFLLAEADVIETIDRPHDNISADSSAFEWYLDSDVFVDHVDGRDSHEVAVWSKANRLPAFPDSGPRMINIPDGASGPIGDPVRAIDPESEALTYSLGGADAANFAVDPATGQLSTAADFTLEYDRQIFHDLTVTATDPAGGIAQVDVIIVVDCGGTKYYCGGLVVGLDTYNDVPHFGFMDGFIGSLTPSAFDYRGETLAIFRITHVFPPGGDIFQIQFSNDFQPELYNTLAMNIGGQRFPFSEADSVTTGGTESSPTTTFTWQLGSTVFLDGQKLAVTMEIHGNAPPVFDGPNPLALQIPDGASGAIHLPVTATDPEGDVFTLSLDGADADSFAIDPLTGQLSTSERLPAMWAAGETRYDFTVIATDGHGDSSSLDVEITECRNHWCGTLVPAADPGETGARGYNKSTVIDNFGQLSLPTTFQIDGRTIEIVKLSTFQLNEHYRGLELVLKGYLDEEADERAIGIDMGDEPTPFKGYELWYANSKSFNNELAGEYYSTFIWEIRTRDTLMEEGTPRPVTFYRADAVPVFPDGSSRALTVPHVVSGPVGEPVTATHSEGLALTYSLGGEHAQYFSIDPATGQLSVREDAMLYYGIGKLNLTVTATDTRNKSTTIEVQGNVDCPPDYLWCGVMRTADLVPGGGLNVHISGVGFAQTIETSRYGAVIETRYGDLSPESFTHDGSEYQVWLIDSYYVETQQPYDAHDGLNRSMGYNYLRVGVIHSEGEAGLPGYAFVMNGDKFLFDEAIEHDYNAGSRYSVFPEYSIYTWATLDKLLPVGQEVDVAISRESGGGSQAFHFDQFVSRMYVNATGHLGGGFQGSLRNPLGKFSRLGVLEREEMKYSLSGNDAHLFQVAGNGQLATAPGVSLGEGGQNKFSFILRAGHPRLGSDMARVHVNATCFNYEKSKPLTNTVWCGRMEPGQERFYFDLGKPFRRYRENYNYIGFDRYGYDFRLDDKTDQWWISNYTPGVIHMGGLSNRVFEWQGREFRVERISQLTTDAEKRFYPAISNQYLFSMMLRYRRDLGDFDHRLFDGLQFRSTGAGTLDSNEDFNWSFDRFRGRPDCGGNENPDFKCDHTAITPTDLMKFRHIHTKDYGSIFNVQRDYWISFVRPNTPLELSLSGLAGSVLENSPGGASLGAAVATDEDGDTPWYQLSGDDASYFTIDPATGRLYTAPDAEFDAETRETYTFTVTAEDGWGGKASADHTIHVKNVTEAPAAPAAPLLTSDSTEGLRLDWKAPADSGHPITSYDIQFMPTAELDPCPELWCATLSAEVYDALPRGLSPGDTIGFFPGFSLGGLSPAGFRIDGKQYNVYLLTYYLVPERERVNDQEHALMLYVEGSGLASAGNAELVLHLNGREFSFNDAADEPVWLCGSGETCFTWYVDSPLFTDGGEFEVSIDYADPTSGLTTIEGPCPLYWCATLVAGENPAGDVGYTELYDEGSLSSDVFSYRGQDIDIYRIVDAFGRPSGTSRQLAVQDGRIRDHENLNFYVNDEVLPFRSVSTGYRYDLYFYNWYPLMTAPFVLGETYWVGIGEANGHPDQSAEIDGLEPGSFYQARVRARNAEGVSPWSEFALGVTLTDVASPPTFVGHKPARRTVPENSVGRRALGTPMLGVDPNGETMTWSLSGADAAYFSIDAASGQLYTAIDFSPDYENRSEYSFTVQVTDSSGEFDTAPVNVQVIDLAEPPAAPDAPAVSTAGTGIIKATWQEPANTGPSISHYNVRHRLLGASNWFDGQHGTPALQAWLHDLTPYVEHEVQVQAVNAEGVSRWSDGGSAFAGLQNPPYVHRFELMGMRENIAGGTPVSDPLYARDPDGDALTWSLISGDTAYFTIDPASGQISTAADFVPDYEAWPTGSYQFVAQATDPYGNSGTCAVAVILFDADEPPATPYTPSVWSPTTEPSLSVEWLEPANTGPPITGYNVRYRQAVPFVDQWFDAGHSGTGRTLQITGLTVDVVYDVAVQAVNDEGASEWSGNGQGTAGGNTDPQAVPDPVPPAFPGYTHEISVAENTTGSIGDPLHDVFFTEADIYAYAIGGDDSDHFGISGASGQLTTVEDTILDFEARTEYHLQVTASDGTVSDTVAVTIRVTDVDEPPDRVDQPRVYTAGANGLTASWDAPENQGRPEISGYNLRYCVDATGCGTDDLWTLADYNGPYTYATIAGLNIHTEYQVQARAVNAEGVGQWSLSGKGTPSGADIPPAFDGSVDDQTWPQGKEINPLTLPRAFAGNGTISYTLTPALPDGLTFNPVSLQISGTPRVSQNAREYTYTAADSDDNTNASDTVSLTFSITLTASNAPVFPPALARLVAENSPIGTNVGSVVTATDPEGDAISYSVAYPDVFGIDAASGQITVQGSLDYESVNSHRVKVVARDEWGNQGWAIVVVEVSDVKEPPARVAGPAVSSESHSLEVFWTAPDNAGKPPINDYDLRYCVAVDCDTAESWLDASHDGAATSGVISYLVAETEYLVQVRARNEEGAGQWSPDGSGVPCVSYKHPAPVFTGIVDDQTWEQGMDIDALTLPEATGGNGTISYTLTPDLPTGLTFDPASRQISGAPGLPQAARKYTYTAASEGNAEETAAVFFTFNITVTATSATQIRVSLSGPEWTSDGRAATYTVSLRGPAPSAPLTVDYATADGTATTADGDYAAAAGTLTFPAGSADPLTVTVNTAASAKYEVASGTPVEEVSEGDEDFTFSISNVAGGGYDTVLGNAAVTTTILDPYPRQFFDLAARWERGTPVEGFAEPVGIKVRALTWVTTKEAVTLVLNFDQPTPTPEEKGLSRDDPEAMKLYDRNYGAMATLASGNNAANADFEVVGGPYTVTFQPGASHSDETTVYIRLLDDNVIETRSEKLFISAAVQGLEPGDIRQPYSIDLAFSEDENLAVKFGFIVDCAEVDHYFNAPEGEAIEMFVKLPNPLEYEAAWTLIWMDNNQYDMDLPKEQRTRFVFPAGSPAGARQSVAFNAVDDDHVEWPEAIMYGLRTPGREVLPANYPVLVIIDNDAPSVSVSGPAEVNGGAAAEYTISLSRDDAPYAVQVDYAISDGTATSSNGDYTATSGTLTIRSSGTVQVPTAAPETGEGPEDFTFTISNARSLCQSYCDHGTPYGGVSLREPFSLAIDTGTVNTTIVAGHDQALGERLPEAPEEPLTVVGVGEQPFRLISVGQHHNCGIMRTHDKDNVPDRVGCWGNDAHSQVSEIPAGDFSHIAVGDGFSCGLSKRTIHCWGDISGVPDVRAFDLAAGADAACAVTRSGGIVCWGDASDGAVSAAPTDTGYREVSVGDGFGCALRSQDRSLTCWGDVAAPPGAGYYHPSAGTDHACAVQDGQAVCWGGNDQEQADAPAGDFHRISAGYGYSCGIRRLGNNQPQPVVCWPDDGGAGRDMPTVEEGVASNGYVQLGAGSEHTCAIVKKTREVVCQGVNTDGKATPP